MTPLEWMLHKHQHLKTFFWGYIFFSYTDSKAIKVRKETTVGRSRENPVKLETDLILRAEYDKLSSIREVTSSRVWLNQSFYDQGDKSSELLARQIKQLETKSIISIGFTVTWSLDIMDVMRWCKESCTKKCEFTNTKLFFGWISHTAHLKWT